MLASFIALRGEAVGCWTAVKSSRHLYELTVELALPNNEFYRCSGREEGCVVVRSTLSTTVRSSEKVRIFASKKRYDVRKDIAGEMPRSDVRGYCSESCGAIVNKCHFRRRSAARRILPSRRERVRIAQNHGIDGFMLLQYFRSHGSHSDNPHDKRDRSSVRQTRLSSCAVETMNRLTSSEPHYEPSAVFPSSVNGGACKF